MTVSSSDTRNLSFDLQRAAVVAEARSWIGTPYHNCADVKGAGVDCGNEDPLQVTRSDPYEAYNVWRLEIAERDNAYNLTSVESRDQNAIELYGMRIAPTVTAHEICDPDVALIAGQLMLQRAVWHTPADLTVRRPIE